MEEKGFREFLREQNVKDKIIQTYITSLEDYNNFLKSYNKDLATVNPDELLNYTEYLVYKDKESVLDFLRAIISYANYTKNYDWIIHVIDISESYNAMDNLYLRVAKIHGTSIRNEIFKEVVVPPLGVDPEKKPAFTKSIMKRAEKILGSEEVINLLSPCLHGRPPDDIPGDKKKLKELGIDGFLMKKHEELINRLEMHKENGTLEFAQYIDDAVIEFIKKDQMFGHGIREGSTIYVKKIPYQAKQFLESQEENMKRYYMCYCPWVRGAMKENTVDDSLNNFCYCSAGWYKLYWDQILENPIKAEPIKTAINGALECKIALHIPERILKPYIK
jgi:hypothetical protein